MTVTRRELLLAAASLPLAAYAANPDTPLVVSNKLKDLEANFQGRLGVGIVTAGQAIFSYRGEERFPMCSTFKAMLAAAILDKARHDPGLLERRIRYTKADLVPWAPVTEKHLDDGMTVEELCDAIVRYSDNPAANLLLAQVGGPAGLTDFMRKIGDRETRLDRHETALNSSIPGDLRDTTTPLAMAASLSRTVLGDVLAPTLQDKLQDWLKRNTTGDERIRAGVPKDWVVGDKTGTSGAGAYGSSNDIAVLWRPGRAPVVLTIYFTTDRKESPSRNDVVAEATRIVVQGLKL